MKKFLLILTLALILSQETYQVSAKFTWWNPLTYIPAVFHLVTFGHYTCQKRFERNLRKSLNEESTAFTNKAAKPTFVSRVRSRILDDLKIDIKYDTQAQLRNLTWEMFYQNSEIMYQDLIDYHETEGKQIIEKVSVEELKRRFSIIQPIFEEQIQEFTEEFS